MADFLALLELKRQVHDPHVQHAPGYFRTVADPITAEELESALKSQGTSVQVLVDDSSVVAYAFLQEIEVRGNRVLNDHKKLFINDFCVDERFRRKGYGSQLMRAIEAIAVSSGCDVIELNVWLWNATALRFYEAVGMRRTMVRMWKPTPGSALAAQRTTHTSEG